jgi:hypothetical protein
MPRKDTEAQREYAHQYYLLHKKEKQEKANARRIANPEASREKCRKWYYHHLEASRERSRNPLVVATKRAQRRAKKKLLNICPHCGGNVGIEEWRIALQLLGVTIDELEKRGIQSVAEQIARERDLRVAAAGKDKPRASRRTTKVGSWAGDPKRANRRKASKRSGARSPKRTAAKRSARK